MYGIIDETIAQESQLFTSSGLINVRTIFLVALKIACKVLQFTAVIGQSIYQSVRPRRLKPIRGQVVLITEAGRGIGRSLSLQLAFQGCTVACVDCDTASNDATVEEINRVMNSGGNQTNLCHGYTCDVADHRQVLRLASQVEEELGRVDILINIAPQAMNPIRPSQINMVNAIRESMTSHLWTVSAFLPGMLVRKQGHIVLVIAATNLIDATENIQYSTSQYAVKELMNSLSEELQLNETKCINLTCVHPFYIDTKALSDLGETTEISLPALSLEMAANEVIKGIRMNLEAITIPRNPLVWINVLRRFRPCNSNVLHVGS